MLPHFPMLKQISLFTDGSCLGNPGPEYEATRHNVGFWFVDHLADKLKIALAPQGKFHGKAGRDGELWLLQPTTFMNRSGQAVAALANFYKITPAEVLVWD